MIDTQRKEERERKKDKTRKRMHAEIDPENYEYTPAKKLSIITIITHPSV